jgi:hypothetical protein
MILRNGTYGDLRIELTVDERSRPCQQLIDEMKQFLAEKLGSDKAAKFEHVSVNDPGFAHFRIDCED